MPRLILVRHGRAAAGWGEDLDPGLDELGRAEASAVADQLAELGPMPIVVSPMRRTRETAAPLEARWGVTARVEPAVGEVQSPTPDLAARTAWLGAFMRSTWDEQPPELHQWRQRLVDALLAIEVDTVVVSHFVAINVAVGFATGDPRVTSFAPDNCSCTTLVSQASGLTLVAAGAEADTKVL
jgi:broad specificity phosphatase PhoE